MRKEPIHPLGYSTDSAGFSLSAVVHLMTARAEETSSGLYYLGLGVDDEKIPCSILLVPSSNLLP